MKIAVWLDDERDPRDSEWEPIVSMRKNGAERVIWAEHVSEFEEEIERIILRGDTLVSVMFDIYLGSGYRDGHEAFEWLEAYAKEMGLQPFSLSCHSQADISERHRMRQGFRRLKSYWRQDV